MNAAGEFARYAWRDMSDLWRAFCEGLGQMIAAGVGLFGWFVLGWLVFDGFRLLLGV